jgi:hypothetical protein
MRELNYNHVYFPFMYVCFGVLQALRAPPTIYIATPSIPKYMHINWVKDQHFLSLTKHTERNTNISNIKNTLENIFYDGFIDINLAV